MNAKSARRNNLIFLPWLSALAAGLLMMGLTMQLEQARLERHQARMRGEVMLKVSTLRVSLESALNKLAYIDESIAVYTSFNAGIDKKRYEVLARKVTSEVKGVRNLALIKGTTIFDVYPLEGNSSAIGLNMLDVPSQAPGVLRMLETGKPILAGPVELVQGGTAFIVRRPIYLVTSQDGAATGPYWGMCSVVIDQQHLYQAAGLNEGYPELNIAIKGADAQGETGSVFYGSMEVFVSEPVRQIVSVPGGEWILVAAPKDGWNTPPPMIWHIRGLSLLVSFTSALLIWFLVRNPIRLRMMVREATSALEDARLNLEQRVAQRTEQLQRANDELQKALSEVKTLSGLLPICASCKKVRDDQGYWNQIEYYIKENSDADFSHSICPDCMRKLYPEVFEKMKKEKWT